MQGPDRTRTGLRAQVTGSGPPLLLVPGGVTGWASWEPLMERLTASRTVVRVQLRNVELGLEAEPLPEDYSPTAETTAAAATLAQLELDAPVDVVGWSYGGGVALELALDHPGVVRTLTLIEPAAPWVLPTLSDHDRRLRDWERAVSRDDVSEAELERFLRETQLVAPGQHPRETPRWEVMCQHRQSLRMLPALWAHERDRTQLAELHVPTLLVKGTGPPAMEHHVVEELARQLPLAEVAEFPGGHGPHLDSADAFLAAMAVFHQRWQAATGTAR